MTANPTPDARRGTAPAPGDELRVTTLELFFDLVFVFTLTQLTSLLVDDPTPIGAARVVLTFVVLFWMYGGYVWLTNAVPPDRAARRLLMIGGMAGFLVSALAITRAFDGGGVVFGLGYLAVVLVHAGLYGQVYGARVVARIAPFNVASALLIIGAGFLDGPVVYAVWVFAIGVELVMPATAARAAAIFPLRPAHFVERHGLLLIVAFGESVVAIGIGTGMLPLDAGLLGAAVLGLALAAGLWWTYFVGDEDGAAHAMSAASPTKRFQLAIRAYFYAYVPMLLGIVAAAAGVKAAIGHVAERLDPAPALMLAGGVAIYLAGDVAFRLALGLRPVIYRAIASAAALATVAIGISTAAVWQLVALVAVIVAALVAEERLRASG